jgi:carboxymethylenebutenolidase
VAIYPRFNVIDTADGPMSTYVCAPEGGEPRAAVLVIQGQGGLNSAELQYAEHLAEAGYVGVAPDLFHRGPTVFSRDEQQARRRKMNDPQVLSDINATFKWLESQPFVATDQPVSILGFCMGGRVSYLVAGSCPNIGAAAVFYGGGIFAGEDGPAPIDLTGNIRCPVLVVDGEQDERPSPEDVRKTAAALAEHGVIHEAHIYPDVGHGFMSRPSPATDAAWKRTVEWLHQYMPPGK